MLKLGNLYSYTFLSLCIIGEEVACYNQFFIFKWNYAAQMGTSNLLCSSMLIRDNRKDLDIYSSLHCKNLSQFFTHSIDHDCPTFYISVRSCVTKLQEGNSSC